VIFGYTITGNWLAIVTAETNWERLVTIPGFSIFNSLFVLIKEGVSFKSYSLLLDLLLVISVLILLFRSYRTLKPLYWNYALLSLLIPLSTSTFLSFPRFLIVIFPLFIAFYLMSNKIIQRIYLIGGLILLHILFLTFLQGGWVA
jgi:hypothetical protein